MREKVAKLLPVLAATRDIHRAQASKLASSLARLEEKKRSLNYEFPGENHLDLCLLELANRERWLERETSRLEKKIRELTRELSEKTRETAHAEARYKALEKTALRSQKRNSKYPA